LNGLQQRIYNTERRIQAVLDANDVVLGNVNQSGTRSDPDAIVNALGDAAAYRPRAASTRLERRRNSGH
jgi:hypothetical protein